MHSVYVFRKFAKGAWDYLLIKYFESISLVISDIDVSDCFDKIYNSDNIFLSK